MLVSALKPIFVSHNAAIAGSNFGTGDVIPLEIVVYFSLMRLEEFRKD